MTLSDGPKADLAFSENHASLVRVSRAGCTSHRRDVVDTLHAPFYGPSTIVCFIMEMVRAIVASRRKDEKEVKRGRKRKGRNTSPLTSYESLRHCCALREDRAGAKWIWHFEWIGPLSSLNLSIVSGWSRRPRVCLLASTTLGVII